MNENIISKEEFMEAQSTLLKYEQENKLFSRHRDIVKDTSFWQNVRSLDKNVNRLSHFTRGLDYYSVFHAYLVSKFSDNEKLDEMVRGAKVLEVGANFGAYVKFFQEIRPDIEVIGVDISNIAVDFAKSEGIDVRHMDMLNMEFKKNIFDYVFSNETIDDTVYVQETIYENRDRMERAFSEIHRVLRPQGQFIFYAQELSDLPIEEHDFEVVEYGFGQLPPFGDGYFGILEKK